jgi:AraC-like DNA-binding protein
MAAPYDQLALADDLWMAAHDKPNGGSLLQPKPLGIGLGAALLCELVLTNWIVDVDEDGMLHLHPDAEHYGLPEDVAMQGVLSQLLQEAGAIRSRNHRHSSQSSGLGVDDWIQHLQADDARRLVEERLAGGSHVRLETRGGMFRATRTVCVPESSSTSGWPAARVKRSIEDGAELTEKDLTLAGLIIAIGLDKEAFEGMGRRAREFLVRQTQARMRRQLRELILRAETAVARIVMTR